MRNVSAEPERKEDETARGAAAEFSVAVIVPVYNNAADLPCCVDSILAQSWKRLSVYLIDDGSADGSAGICDRYAADFANVHAVHQTNGGLMAAWQRGLREAAEDWICFVDGDDWIEPEMIEALVCAGTAAEEAQPGLLTRQLVCCSYLIEREWENRAERKGHGAAPGVYTGERLEKEIRRRVIGCERRAVILSRCMKLVPRELLTEGLPYCNPAIRMGEDVNIMLPVLLSAGRVVILPGHYDYHYRFRRESMVHRYDPRLCENIRALDAVIRRVLRDFAVPEAEAMADREFAFLFLLLLKNELRRTDISAGEAVSRIRALCGENHSEALLAAIGGPRAVREPANRLLALLMRRPSPLRVRIIRRIFLWQAKA
ncbi:glycosyltransferase family 2 protein [Lachnoclostridium sp. Marseille-P6806]|uniref:glycosyltransferase family 2 protein n=1 Tax=Lachnoclostridium sp. Marseille-P6806 TaxID=2364793 RepID=UPI00103014F1|nr:glycosyltransferase family 2 protein [Lachnoclostridium sp. Marseille-P6806]